MLGNPLGQINGLAHIERGSKFFEGQEIVRKPLSFRLTIRVTEHPFALFRSQATPAEFKLGVLEEVIQFRSFTDSVGVRKNSFAPIGE